MENRKKNYESEIRIWIENIREFQSKLEELNSQVIRNYKFIDEIYKPIGDISWDHQKKTIRIRKYSNEKDAKILFSYIDFVEQQGFQFKRSKYPGGKLALFKGDKNRAKQIMNDLGFQYFFSIEKSDGKLIKIPLESNQNNFIIALEQIKGWIDAETVHKCEVFLAEIEVWANNIRDITNIFNKRLDYLDISIENVISDSVPFYISKKLKLL